MVRLFQTNKIRKSTELDGLWNFEAEGKKCKMPVPACWEMFPDFSVYRGEAVYRRTVNVTKKTHLRFVFKGVSHTARVFFDGIYVGEHYNAYTPFDFVIKDVPEGSHELTVEVSNTFGEHSSLHIPNDYYTYGGITRPVLMEHLPNAFIERVEFIPKRIDGMWKANVNAFVKVIGKPADNLFLYGEINDVHFEYKPVANPDSDELTFSAEVEAEGVLDWDCDTPNLYLLHTSLYNGGAVIDDLTERVGFREVRVDGTKILLNGEEIFIKGFNRHEDHAGYGCSLSLLAMAKDIALMKDMNANTVRTSHYPNDELFLDLCDEHGILVWEENHARGLTEAHMRNPNFDKQCRDCIDEMVKNHFNHPSIIIWAVMNECASHTEYGRKCYEEQISQIRRLDGSRPVTYATCQHYKDICLDLADIVSWNLYFGWYDNMEVFKGDTRSGVNRLIEHCDAHGGAGKPWIIAEFGAGAIPGYRDPRRMKWTEERQCDILEDNTAVYLSHERIAGALVWQYCDCQVHEEWSMGRPRTKNNKGVVDEFRRPKLAYDIIKRAFGGR
jgi:beta-glucuronidase